MDFQKWEHFLAHPVYISKLYNLLEIRLRLADSIKLMPLQLVGREWPAALRTKPVSDLKTEIPLKIYKFCSSVFDWCLIPERFAS